MHDPSRRRSSRRTAAAAAALGLVLAGCSLIGYGIGAVVDSHNSKPRPIQGWNLEKIKKGARIRLFLRDGSEIAGVFQAVEAVPEEYAERYAAWRGAGGAAPKLPALGDRVSVGDRSGAKDSGIFAGFDLAGVVLRSGAGAAVQARRYADISELATEGGDPLSGRQLAALAGQGALPLRSRLVVGEHRVPLERVSQVQVPTHTGRLAGFLLGAAVDVIAIVALARTSEDTGRAICEGGCTSCPFVESFDGRRYVVEAEAFGGAIFKAVQQPDWTRLDHLTAVNGRYHLRLTNDQEEIQYVDEARLLVVDGPRAARIVPARDGRLHALAALAAPIRATTLRGEDVTPLVAARDDDAWISNPLGRDPERAEDLRDGLILHFARPADARAVTLVFRLRSTPWVSMLLQRLLALHGPRGPEWSAQMEADPVARGSFLDALRREGMPAVSVWNGKSWQPAGFLVNPGPVAFREQALPVDIGSIEDDVLRVRLESSPGTWMVDSAEAGYGPEPALQVTELRAVEAHGFDGADLRGILDRDDGLRHVMRPHRDPATLVFAAPPPRPGLRRSVVAKVSGYYTILVPSDGPPQEELFARLVGEPGAFARYSLGQLYAELESGRAALGRAEVDPGAGAPRPPAETARAVQRAARRVGALGSRSARKRPV